MREEDLDEYGDRRERPADMVRMKGNPMANYPAHFELGQSTRVTVQLGAEVDVYSTEGLCMATGIDVYVSSVTAGSLQYAIFRIYAIVAGQRVLCEESIHSYQPSYPTNGQRVTYARNRIASYFVVTVEGRKYSEGTWTAPVITAAISVSGADPHANETADQESKWLPVRGVSELIIQPGTMKLLFFKGFNHGPTTTYIMLFDSNAKAFPPALPSAGATGWIDVIPAPTGDVSFTLAIDQGIQLMYGLVMVCSTDPVVYTPDSSAIIVGAAQVRL